MSDTRTAYYRAPFERSQKNGPVPGARSLSGVQYFTLKRCPAGGQFGEEAMMTLFQRLVLMAACSMATAQAAALQGERPEGFEQIIPRGRIAAIQEPVYVSAGEARIAPSSWVLGVVIEGQARAFSLKLLNSHEVVNDTIGETNFAAVW